MAVDSNTGKEEDQPLAETLLRRRQWHCVAGNSGCVEKSRLQTVTTIKDAFSGVHVTARGRKLESNQSVHPKVSFLLRFRHLRSTSLLIKMKQTADTLIATHCSPFCDLLLAGLASTRRLVANNPTRGDIFTHLHPLLYRL